MFQSGVAPEPRHCRRDAFAARRSLRLSSLFVIEIASILFRRRSESSSASCSRFGMGPLLPNRACVAAFANIAASDPTHIFRRIGSPFGECPSTTVIGSSLDVSLIVFTTRIYSSTASSVCKDNTLRVGASWRGWVSVVPNPDLHRGTTDTTAPRSTSPSAVRK